MSAREPQHDGLGPDEDELLTVGRVADLVGVSVRTLHHWDEIGLAKPEQRATWSDYRLYGTQDIARIQRVLVYRELGFGLAEIGGLIEDERVGVTGHLHRQRDLLTARISRLQEMVSAVDRMMEVTEMKTNLTPEQQAEIFGSDWNPEYAKEAEERWGGTEQWAQSQQRTAAMSAQDWTEMKATGDEVNADLAAAARAGVDPGSQEAGALAERHRELIGTFYDCSHAMQVCLGRMYVEDQRFAAFYDDLEPGLAAWLRAAIEANARRHGVDPDSATWQ